MSSHNHAKIRFLHVGTNGGREMARTVEKLSALAVNKTTKPGYYGDGAGLYLQVSKSGTKSWIFRFTFAARQREMGLGPLHTVGLADARVKARECRTILLAGKDPLEARSATKLAEALDRAKMITFDQCASAYIAAHRGSWKNAKHASQWENTLETYAGPIIGAMPVASVDTALVVKVLNPIWQEKTETATRLRGRIESILDWATVSKYRVGENPARWRGHLENLLADPNKLGRVEHHPALPWQELVEFMVKLRSREGVAARAVDFAILTACRSGEVRGATWAEIDIEGALWTIPSERMKAGREHRVPLSSSAVDILMRMPQVDDLVFPGRRQGTALSDMSLTAVLRRMSRPDITVHGFRSTFRDWCAESVANSFPREVCEHALAHSLPDKVEAAYRRGDLLVKRTMLMQTWADFCAGKITG
ncbi:tyrosine-type recombinase/integrase [Massilia violaceinigra]|nr:site-specific integrase [Massilia violaceinigra]